ncbi:glutamine--fructose-6-phosphate aminotransferase, partial [Candidatus Micrarchaeota archaeon]|nr:glutamine--fructose-6-phosphate aminotransferase [Candidatus Micrarchaeota archaeon]
MCGIVGYIGGKKASLVVLEALKNVEYRGYDSAGIAVLNSKIQIIKDVGKLAEIEKKHNFSSLEGTMGIGHTRWATHGSVNSMNAHPHTDESGQICLVHNGIIENFQ